jgi:hypothetical protein
MEVMLHHNAYIAAKMAGEALLHEASLRPADFLLHSFFLVFIVFQIYHN